MENEYKEYETFEMEVNGKQTEFAIEEEFEVEGKKYVLAAKVEGDTIAEEGCYIFSGVEKDGESLIEKITDKEEYAKVTEAYMKMQEA